MSKTALAERGKHKQFDVKRMAGIGDGPKQQYTAGRFRSGYAEGMAEG